MQKQSMWLFGIEHLLLILGSHTCTRFLASLQFCVLGNHGIIFLFTSAIRIDFLMHALAIH